VVYHSERAGSRERTFSCDIAHAASRGYSAKCCFPCKAVVRTDALGFACACPLGLGRWACSALGAARLDGRPDVLQVREGPEQFHQGPKLIGSWSKSPTPPDVPTPAQQSHREAHSARQERTDVDRPANRHLGTSRLRDVLSAVPSSPSTRRRAVESVANAHPAEAVALPVTLQRSDVCVESSPLDSGSRGDDQVQVQHAALLSLPDLGGHERAGAAAAACDLCSCPMELGPAALSLSIPGLSSSRDDPAALRSSTRFVRRVGAERSIPDQACVFTWRRDRHQSHGVEFQEAPHQQMPPVLRPYRPVRRTRAATAPLPAVERPVAGRAATRSVSSRTPHRPPRGNAPRRGGSSALGTERRVPPVRFR
jgi:hypothetical protein